MIKSEHVFHIIAGTNITAKALLPYAINLGAHFDTRVKLEKAYKRKTDRLENATQDVIKFTNRLLDNVGVRELADVEAESIEQVLFLACGLTASDWVKVIEFMNNLQEEEAGKAVPQKEKAI